MKTFTNGMTNWILSLKTILYMRCLAFLPLASRAAKNEATCVVGGFQSNVRKENHIGRPMAMTYPRSFVSMVWRVSAALWLVAFSAAAWTKTGTIYTTDGSQADVQSAVDNASPSDTVSIPSGTFTWGAGSAPINIATPITISGAGTNSTFIQLSSTGPTYTTGAITCYTNVLINHMTFIGTVAGPVSSIAEYGAYGWHVTDVLFEGADASGYFLYAEGGYGLVDRCNLQGGNGECEMIFVRGPTNSWQTADSTGTTNVVCIENNIFGGQGYVCDGNANSRMLVRFNTINGLIKVDGHGKATNIDPARGVRHMEIYDNSWTVASYYTGIDIRGGSGFCFNNTNPATDGNQVWLFVHDYGIFQADPNFGSVYMTPTYYPIDDMIGVGQDPKVAASDPLYLWNNVCVGGGDWFIQWDDIPAAAIAQYTNETGNVNSTYVEADIIKADRDYFRMTNNLTFTGVGGVGMGTKLQMNSITPTKTGVGFWVTDEGSWNTILPANTSGQLYVWNGSAWVLYYTPLTYPCPLAVVPGECTPGPTCLVAWWRGEGDFVDSVGGNNGSVTEGSVGFAPAEVGEGFGFDGSDNRIEVPDASALNFDANQDFSIEAWIQPDYNPNNNSGVMSIVDKRNAYSYWDDPNGYEFSLQDGEIHCRFRSTGFGPYGPDLRDGNFHHVVLSVSRNSTTGGNLYVDGQLVGTFDPTSYNDTLINTEPLRIGNHAQSDFNGFFLGIIDEVSIYNCALTADQIANFYRAGTGGKCP